MSAGDTATELAQGYTLQQQGRLAEAATLFRQAIAREPNNGDALHLLGVTLGRMGQAQEAVLHLQAAADARPSNPYILANFGHALSSVGRHSEAAGAFGRAAALKPDLLAAHRGRAFAELSERHYEEALRSIDQALVLHPRDAVMLANRGNALRALKRLEEALASYDRSLALAPGEAEVHHCRALALISLERYEDALGSLERAQALAPQRFGIHFHRGVALSLLERHAEALLSFERALTIEPRSAEALSNRGVELGHLGRSEEALASFAKAAEAKPDYIDAFNNAAGTLNALGRREEALQQFDRALSIEPDHAPTLWSKGLLKLAQGEYEEGWPLYEARLRLEYLREYHRSFSTPRWTGSEDLAGKRILIHAEQGLGDALQFCRYLPLLEDKGAQIVFEVPEALAELMRSVRFGGTLICQGDPVPSALDYHCPLLSLPLAFGTRADTIPAEVPYLKADPAAVASWRNRLSALPGLKIGLNWQGHAGAEKQAWIRGRSFALACAAPLARLPGVSLISLQKGAAAGQRSQVDFGGALAQLTDPDDVSAHALAETAALLSALDLIVTSDTSVAHLAGALGLPVWVALHAAPDWRWLLERSDSPWYPTMRLFRQRAPGDWLELFERLAREVGELAAG
ncbi:MAG TPA: tetratricopeptide repeat protein [Steroidobacteraceae bacterium]|nr:tetratricopeptide repeat protein [Steroidobacteraceae bacterium]